MKRKSKKQQAKNTASHLSLVVALIGFGWLSVYSLSVKEVEYLTEAEMEAIAKGEPEPVTLIPLKQPKNKDAEEEHLISLLLHGNESESAKARQLLARR